MTQSGSKMEVKLDCKIVRRWFYMSFTLVTLIDICITSNQISFRKI